MTEFSAAWCPSIVSQGAKATYIRTQSTQYNFASLRIVEGSAGGVVAASELKAVELDFFSTSNCFSSCFLHAPVGDPFYKRYSPFNNMDPLSETDVIQSDSAENFVVIFEILPTDKECKSNEITSCRCWASCGFNGKNATHQVDFFPTSTIHSNSNSSTVFCFTEQNSNSVSFSQSQCCRLLKVLSSGFSSEVDVVLGEVVYHKFQAHHY